MAWTYTAENYNLHRAAGEFVPLLPGRSHWWRPPSPSSPARLIFQRHDFLGSLVRSFARQETEHLVQQRCSVQCRQAASVERWRDLDQVGSHKSNTAHAAQQADRFAHGEAAGLRCAGARREHRIEGIDVEREVGRSSADDAPGLADHAIDAEI